REVNDFAVARHDEVSGGELFDDPAFHGVPQRQHGVVCDDRSRFEQTPAPGRNQQRQARVNSRVLAALENTLLPLDRSEQLAVLGQGLRGAEKELAAGPQRVMKYWHQLLLQLLVEINQQIAARDQVDARER